MPHSGHDDDDGGDPRTLGMRRARREDSERKRARIIAALQEMEAEGARITFAGLAARADVSRGHTYKYETLVREAQKRQDKKRAKMKK